MVSALFTKSLINFDRKSAITAFGINILNNEPVFHMSRIHDF